MKTILFYSSVKDLNLFKTQRFYAIDIALLKKIGYNVLVTNKLSSFLKFWNYNLAFLYFYRYSFFAGLIARFFGKSVYFTGGIDALEISFSTPIAYYIQTVFFKLCYLVSSKCIIVSHSDLQNIQRISNRKLTKISFSQHTIDAESFDSNKSKEKIFSSIVWMGNKENVIRKGVDRALELFALLIQNDDRFKEYNFIVVGEKGEGTIYLLDLCNKLGIEDKVFFMGAVSEDIKINLLARSTYYFQLSKYEGFGIAALEALASGNIVIHSGNGGLKDTIKNYGVIVNLKEDNDTIYCLLKEKLFDKFDTKEINYYVSANFSNKKREDDLKIIIQ